MNPLATRPLAPQSRIEQYYGTDAENRRNHARAQHAGAFCPSSRLPGLGMTGYAQSLLVMERFGYPDFLIASADELIDGQYAGRPRLRPILDAIIAAAAGLGEVTIQARKTYVSLVSPRRTFARVQPTTKNRVDLGLRLEGRKPKGRLQPSKIQETMQVQIGLTAPEEVDSEVLGWLQQ